MYIKSARITNIRSIEDFEINFEEPAGWHVLIGDNGSGKSTIIRSIALALVGPDEAPGLRADWRDWLNSNKDEGKIELQIEPSGIDEYVHDNMDGWLIPNILTFKRNPQSVRLIGNIVITKKESISPFDYNWGNNYGWFSAAYGPYRRFTGGDSELDVIYPNQPKLGAHLSALSEAAALTEATKWLVRLNYKMLEQYSKDKMNDLNSDVKESSTISMSKNKYEKIEKYSAEEKQAIIKGSTIVQSDYLTSTLQSFQEFRKNSIIGLLETLINFSDFLPNNTKLERISSEGVFFKDSSGSITNVNQLSDGFRSILSLIFELVRQLIRVYGEELVFKNIRKNQKDSLNIDLPGVVLIDEIDAHLHPTWQTKIGQWFTKYFPNLQFIVTTHSPLVCRAAEKGTIWKLAAPGSGEKSEQVTGIDRDRLVYGNILDAYGTEEFGIVDNTKAVHKKEELVRLSKKQTAGKISPEEENKLHELRAIFSTDATIEL